MKQFHRKSAKGQAMEVIALLLALGVLIGLVAIAFDGGSALLQRRTQENGAQAGVMAGINLMAQNVVGSCVPTPCHPAYQLRNSDVYAAVKPMLQANRGGLTNPPTPADADYSNVYGYSIEYHYSNLAGTPTRTPRAGTPTPTPTPSYTPRAGTPTAIPTPTTSPCSPLPCYAPATNNASPIPDFVDGLAVTSSVNDPTTFGRALPVPINSLNVGGQAAAQLRPACAPVLGDGPTVPFTRFRPSIEQEMLDHSNEPDHLFEFWSPNIDFNGNWKNQISLRATSVYGAGAGSVGQLLTKLDRRNGPMWNYSGPNTPSNFCSGNNCANMAGTPPGNGNKYDDKQDMGNWIFWNWNGTISLNTTWPVNGQPGDWAEAYGNGDWGNNVSNPVGDLIDRDGFMTPNGKAIDRMVYLWGPSLSDYNSHGQTTTDTAQQYNTRTESWENMTVEPGTNPKNIGRVRFTRAVAVRFFAGSARGSNAPGLILTQSVPGPEDGCSADWVPGGGVYTRQIDPNP